MGIREGATIIFLVVNGWKDWKKREVSLALTGIYGGLGLILNLLSGRKWTDFIVPAGIGLFFLLMGVVSRGALGMGDGWVLTALGVALETVDYIRMFCGGMLLTALAAGVLLTISGKNCETEIPFVPFLFCGYLGGILI